MDDSDDLHSTAGDKVKDDIGLERPDGKREQPSNYLIQTTRTNPRVACQQIESLLDHVKEPVGCPWVSFRNVGRVLVDILGSPPSSDDFHRRFLAIDRRKACRRLVQ